MSEAQPRLQQHLLELLIAQLKDFAVVLMDKDGRFTSWHPGVRQIFQYNRDEFLGQPVEILFTAPDRQMGVVGRELQAAKQTGVANDTRWLSRRDGSLTMVDGVTIALRSEDGELAGFGKVLRDVTEQKNTQDRLQTLTDALDESNVIVRSWDGVIQHWTTGCERLYGWSAADAVGAICSELLQTITPVSGEEIRQQLLNTGTWRGEVEQRRRDGRLVAIATQWALVRDGLQAPMRVIETQTDVSERSIIRRQLETVNEELHRVAKELERSNEELSEFARIASHDLGAPLTSAGWLVDLLITRNNQQLDETGRDYLAQLKRSLNRMSDLIEGILAHARAGMGSIRTAETSDAGLALATAIENLGGDIERFGAVIERSSLPWVPVDGHAMTQLFQNLLSNAIKYRKQDETPFIEVRAEEKQSEWLFAVKDNGIGVEPAWAERIFLPMQRSHHSDVAGSGIGLATCRKIVSRAGGRIWVESQPGSGATFFFTIPAAADNSAAPKSAPPQSA